jgi:hypothetical protein
VELGAEEFYAAGEADDSEGMDKTVCMGRVQRVGLGKLCVAWV